MAFNIFDDHVPLEVFGVYRDTAAPYDLPLSLPGPTLRALHGSSHTFGTGALLWNAAVLLAAVTPEYIHPGRKVLELGAGLGIPGMAAAFLGASVTLTDLPKCLPVTADSLRANGFREASEGSVQWIHPLAAHSLTLKELNWLDPAPDGFDDGVDVILGADITIYTDRHEALINLLLKLATTETTILLAHEERGANQPFAFGKIAAPHFDVTELPSGTQRQACGIQSDDVVVYQLKRRASTK